MRLLFKILSAAGTAAVMLIVLVLAADVSCWKLPQLSGEVIKILLQFLLVTVTGGTPLAILSWRQSERQRRQAIVEKLQDLDDQLGEAYRNMKACKRRIRSCRVAPPPAGLEIPAEAFERLMDQILSAQLAMEEVQDSISTRRHLLGEEDRSTIEKLLRYPARYLHDVYEDFEKGRVRRSEGSYLGAEAGNLRDFIDPDALPEPIAVDLAQFSRRNLPLKERVEAFDRLRAEERRIASEESQRTKREVNRRRFARVAYEACRTASQVMKGLVDAEIARLGKF